MRSYTLRSKSIIESSPISEEMMNILNLNLGLFVGHCATTMQNNTKTQQQYTVQQQKITIQVHTTSFIYLLEKPHNKTTK